ncbi:hypothetical protein [Dyella telluris]|uniref:Uncharacterized protein n=1 Tax=Dyella telluris TaxID=2763498 RepID=A0A7G8Q2W8_9GAMM|nr:hypothetical protein [Dyella telluris]QNK01126.1 hypothetical protein H8F01_19020 [Dyella telluris]
MTAQDDVWSEWGELWREQPTVDVAHLQRQALHKRRRMQGTVALELTASLIAVAQCVRLALRGTAHWAGFGIAALVFVVLLQCLYLHARRGTWRASGCDVASLLRLTRRRAQAGIRLAHIYLWSTLALVAVALCVAAPELAPARWASDAQLRHLLVLQLSINGPIVAATVVACLWYQRRQRARLARVDALLMADDDSGRAHRLD